jgi:hypothetical protein
MTSPTSSEHRELESLHQLPEFSLLLGGPLFQLLRRAHLANDALMMVRQRMLVFILVVWCPLVVLAAFEGQLWSNSVAVPLLFDIEVHVRFLVAMPVLILAELVIHQRMRPLLQQFDERNLIPESAVDQFMQAVNAAFRLRNSVWAEVVLILVVYGIGISVVWRQYFALDAATWYTSVSADGSALTLAGSWYCYVSLPIFQFLLLRWYFRMFIWGRFLWHISRIPLRLVPTHPDRLGGLGFISGQVRAFSLIGVALGALLAGNLANQIFFMGATLPQFKLEIGCLVIGVICLALGPLLLLAPLLSRTKRTGLIEYGTLAQRYVAEFDHKWLRDSQVDNSSFLGSGDIQSLADLGNSFEVISSMRVIPVNRDDVFRLAIATLAPIVPLGLTMMSPEELLNIMLKFLF